MKIHYVQGDLIAGNEIVIAHGCNARGAFASGVAGVIRKELPFAYHAYRQAFEDASVPFVPGDIIWAFDIGNNTSRRIVANMITQQDFGREPGRVYVSYPAIKVAIRKVNDFIAATQSRIVNLAEFGSISSVGFPLIGAGLGGGSWPTIAEIIEHESICFQPVVYTLDGNIPS